MSDLGETSCEPNAFYASRESAEGNSASNFPLSHQYSDNDGSSVGSQHLSVSMDDTFDSDTELSNEYQSKRVDLNSSPWTSGNPNTSAQRFRVGLASNGTNLDGGEEGQMDPKVYNASKHSRNKTNKGRRNFRENKRSSKKRRNCNKSRNKGNVPHSGDIKLPPGYEELSSDQDDGDISFGLPPGLPPEKTQLRNDMFRASLDTEPMAKQTLSEELMSLLATAAGAPDLVPESHREQLDEWVGHLENLTILGYQMSQASNYMDCFVAVVAYLKMYVKGKSITMEIFNLINEATRIDDDDIDPHSWSGRDFVEGWDVFKCNPMFKKISYLLSAAMSLSVCTVKSIEWNPMGLQLVSIEAAKEQLKAVDFIDAVVKTFVWMAETGWQVFSEKSLAPLLYGDAKMRNYNEQADYVLSHADSACAGNLPSVNDFEKKLDDVLELTISYKKAQPSGPTALWLQKRYSELVAIKSRLIAKRRNTNIRFAPIGWSLSGDSGVGKSTLSKITMKTSLSAMGFSTDPDRIITIDCDDKYQSTYTSDIEGVYIDDFGNTKTQFSEKPPASLVTKFFNNMAAQAVKAELQEKGVVFICFKCGVITTNVTDLLAREVSNCPGSILRRFTHVATRVKSKFRKPGSVSLDPTHPELVGAKLTKDVWELDVSECIVYESRSGKTTYRFQIMTVKVLDGRTIYCKNLNLSDYLDVVVALSRRHKSAQVGVVARAEEFDVMDMCEGCCKPEALCSCPQQKSVEPHSLDFIAGIAKEAVQKSFMNYFNSFYRPLELINSVVGYAPVRNMTTKALTQELTREMDNKVTPILIAITPEWLYRTSVFQRSVSAWRHAAGYYDVRNHMRALAFIGGAMFTRGVYTRDKQLCGWSMMTSMIGSGVLHCIYRQRVRRYEDEYVTRRDALPEYAKNVRDGVIPKFALFSATLVVGVTMIRLWNAKRIETAHYSPDSLKDPRSMDSKPGWFGYVFQKMGLSAQTQKSSTTAVTSQLVTTLGKNCFWAEFKRPDGSATRCNIFFPRKGVAVFPQHVFYKDANMTLTPSPSLEVIVTRSEKGAGGKFEFLAELDTSVVSDSHDLVFVFVPNCPDIKDATMWLPTSKPSGMTLATIVARNADHETHSDNITVTMEQVGHKYMDFYGGSYSTKLAQTGACMAPVISDTKRPVILGFHIGGNTSSQLGVLQTLTLPEYNLALNKLERIPGVLLSAQATDIPKMQYGKPVLQSDEVHPNAHYIRGLGNDAYIEVLGSTRARTVQKSRVVKSVLSDAVAEQCGVCNIWDKPKLAPNWKAYNATLEHIVNPSKMFLPSELERARQDWLEPLLPAMDEYVKHEDFRPLRGKEIVLGIPGKRFLDAVPMDTGMGFPVFGPKINHFEEIRKGEILVDRIPDAEVKAEMARQRACWMRGERAYPVSAATLKDEPTPLDSEKVRVFQAVAVAFGLQIREFFLPIARFLSMHPLLSESAVGVNAFSQDWEELMQHSTKFADDDQVIAWDYSKYDVRMNSQITTAVLNSFIDLAERGGYCKEDLYIMRMMVADLVHPLLDYNGTLIMAYNMNTSGNNLTVNINGTGGSFYVRMGYFNVYPRDTHFRSKVAAMTYGDDFKGSVAKTRREFNFFRFRDFLASKGMKITPPDKKSDGAAFMEDGEADFLKRNSVYIDEIGHSLGALDEMSIFKSLHSNLLSSSVTQREVAVSCVETALHEWFAYGREHYDMRSDQLRKACIQADLPITHCFTSFDSRVEMWKEKYESSNM